MHRNSEKKTKSLNVQHKLVVTHEKSFAYQCATPHIYCIRKLSNIQNFIEV